LTWGAAVATVVWIAASWAFSYYLQNFADYNATYGTLGAVVGFMVWTWISVIILLAGAELNAEMEHQTERDSTTGPPKPMGQRGAVMADTLGKAADEG
jgi:membrane protein